MTELKQKKNKKTKQNKKKKRRLCVCWAVFTLLKMYKINTLYVGYFDCSCIIGKKKLYQNKNRLFRHNITLRHPDGSWI